MPDPNMIYVAAAAAAIVVYKLVEKLGWLRPKGETQLQTAERWKAEAEVLSTKSARQDDELGQLRTELASLRERVRQQDELIAELRKQPVVEYQRLFELIEQLLDVARTQHDELKDYFEGHRARTEAASRDLISKLGDTVRELAKPNAA